MDYEKKYNEALERAKQKIDAGFLTEDDLSYIFPELRESEDERIRKFLLDYAIEMIAGLESDISLSTYDGIKGHDPDAEAELTQWQKARGYLEKQKEQKPDIEICPHSIKSKSYKENGYPTDDKAFEEWIDGWFKEHKEKAYPQITMDEKEFKNFCRGIRNMYQQKPAECSEVELEFRGEKVTVKRPFYRDDKGRGYSTAELDEEVAWNALRAWCEKKGISLYDLYPKAAWSEEAVSSI